MPIADAISAVFDTPFNFRNLLIASLLAFFLFEGEDHESSGRISRSLEDSDSGRKIVERSGFTRSLNTGHPYPEDIQSSTMLGTPEYDAKK